MDMFIKLGRYLLAFALAVLGLVNLVDAPIMAGMVPSWVPGGTIWVYLTGLSLLAAAVSITLNKNARLAGVFVAGLMLIFILTVYLPKVMAGDTTALTGLFKDLAIAGGALIFASTQPA